MVHDLPPKRGTGKTCTARSRRVVGLPPQQHMKFRAAAVVAAGVALLIGYAAAPLAQPPGLKIVVIEGEDAINIIQTNTAVKPVIEVRDRNDLPVAGALVLFSLGGGNA